MTCMQLSFSILIYVQYLCEDQKLFVSNNIHDNRWGDFVEEHIKENTKIHDRKYEENSRVKRLIRSTLRNDWDRGNEITDYFSTAMTLVIKMQTHEEHMDDVLIVEKILKSLVKKFNYIFCIIGESKNIEELLTDEL